MNGIFVGGFAIFSMFFGSGNLVYPLIVGAEYYSNITLVSIGFLLTAVGVPFLGLLALVRYQGSIEEFFKPLGYVGYRAITIFLLSIAGPFGAIPRNIAVAHGSIYQALPDVSLFAFSLCFCLALAIFTWQKQYVVSWIAYLMTPFKLGGLLALTIFGVYSLPPIQWAAETSNNFWPGLKEGYQTMDLIASFFFSSAIYTYLQRKSSENLGARAFGASIVGACMLVSVYFGFILLSAKGIDFLAGQSPQNFLSILSKVVFGQGGAYFTGFVVTVACLTTATILTSLFADLIPFGPRWLKILITVGLNFYFSLVGFAEIRIFLEKILIWIYPFLVVFTIWRLVCPGLCCSRSRLPS